MMTSDLIYLMWQNTTNFPKKKSSTFIQEGIIWFICLVLCRASLIWEECLKKLQLPDWKVPDCKFIRDPLELQANKRGCIPLCLREGGELSAELHYNYIILTAIPLFTSMPEIIYDMFPFRKKNTIIF